MPNPGYPPSPLGGTAPVNLNEAASIIWIRRVVEVLNGVLAGKQNVILPVTLTANSTTTTLTDPRISYFSVLLFSPLTANAAAALGGLYVSAQRGGTATLTHASTATTDRNYNMAIFG